MSKSFFSLMIVCLSCCLLNACSQQAAADEIQAASNVAAQTIKQPEKPVIPVNLLTNQAELARAKQLLQQRPEFSGSSILVFEKINFFDGVRPRIELAAQNPALPEQLIFYTYEQGKWTPSEAEDISHIKQLKVHLFDLESVDFAQVVRVAKLWHSQAKSVQAAIDEPYFISFVYLPKNKTRFWHTAMIEATGVQYYLSARENGEIWEWNKIGAGAAEEQ